MKQLISSLSKRLLPRAAALALLLSATGAVAIERLPTFNPSYYKDGQIVKKHLGKLIAIDAVIEKVMQGPENKPIFKVKLSGDGNASLWVASLIQMDQSGLPLGRNIKILGYLDESKNEPEFIAKVTSDESYLLAFCLHDMKTNLPNYLNRWLQKCLSWRNGEITPEISH